MYETDKVRMKIETARNISSHEKRLVKVFVAVAYVAHDRTADVGQMNAYLVRPAGTDSHLQSRKPSVGL
jgi:hypothetical protein